MVAYAIHEMSSRRIADDHGNGALGRTYRERALFAGERGIHRIHGQTGGTFEMPNGGTSSGRHWDFRWNRQRAPEVLQDGEFERLIMPGHQVKREVIA